MEWDDPPEMMMRRLRDKSLVIQHPERERIAAEIERLEAAALDAQRLSLEWMRKHDNLLGFIQARPAMLKELIAPTRPYPAGCLAREVPGATCQAPYCDCNP